MTRRDAVRIRVPGSTANLGPGFDALGMALGIHDTVEIARADTPAVEVTGEGADEVPRDEGHLVLRALRAGAELLGDPVGAVRLRCANAIPHARGLGSSAAAVAAGIAAAYGLAGRALDARALHLAAELESHADNVAASLFGGLQLTWCEHGTFRAVGLHAHPGLRPVALVPRLRSSTRGTRDLLPATVPHRDAAFAAGRAALAVHALTTAPELLLPATEDRLHQEYRRPAWPESATLVDALRSGGTVAAISGAGPAVLAFEPVPDPVPADGFSLLRLPVDPDGVRVTPLE